MTQDVSPSRRLAGQDQERRAVVSADLQTLVAPSRLIVANVDAANTNSSDHVQTTAAYLNLINAARIFEEAEGTYAEAVENLLKIKFTRQITSAIENGLQKKGMPDGIDQYGINRLKNKYITLFILNGLGGLGIVKSGNLLMERAYSAEVVDMMEAVQNARLLPGDDAIISSIDQCIQSLQEKYLEKKYSLLREARETALHQLKENLLKDLLPLNNVIVRELLRRNTNPLIKFWDEKDNFLNELLRSENLWELYKTSLEELRKVWTPQAQTDLLSEFNVTSYHQLQGVALTITDEFINNVLFGPLDGPRLVALLTIHRLIKEFCDAYLAFINNGESATGGSTEAVQPDRTDGAPPSSNQATPPPSASAAIGAQINPPVPKDQLPSIGKSPVSSADPVAARSGDRAARSDRFFLQTEPPADRLNAAILRLIKPPESINQAFVRTPLGSHPGKPFTVRKEDLPALFVGDDGDRSGGNGAGTAGKKTTSAAGKQKLNPTTEPLTWGVAWGLQQQQQRQPQAVPKAVDAAPTASISVSASLAPTYNPPPFNSSIYAPIQPLSRQEYITEQKPPARLENIGETQEAIEARVRTNFAELSLKGGGATLDDTPTQGAFTLPEIDIRPVTQQAKNTLATFSAGALNLTGVAEFLRGSVLVGSPQVRLSNPVQDPIKAEQDQQAAARKIAELRVNDAAVNNIRNSAPGVDVSAFIAGGFATSLTLARQLGENAKKAQAWKLGDFANTLMVERPPLPLSTSNPSPSSTWKFTTPAFAQPAAEAFAKGATAGGPLLGNAITKTLETVTSGTSGQ